MDKVIVTGVFHQCVSRVPLSRPGVSACEELEDLERVEEGITFSSFECVNCGHRIGISYRKVVE